MASIQPKWLSVLIGGAVLIGVCILFIVLVTRPNDRPQAEFGFSGINLAAIQEWKAARADHDAIAFAVAQCHNLGDLASQPTFVNDHLMLRLAPSGERVSYGKSGVNADTQHLKLTSFQRGTIYLSNVIARGRIETASAVNDSFTQMKNFQTAAVIIAAITTILISIKSISSTDTKWPNMYFSIGILAIIFSSIGTAASGLNSFYNPREAYVQNRRSLSMLKQLHVEVAAEISGEMNADKCLQMTENSGKKLKDWSTRLTSIFNTSESTAQSEGKVTQTISLSNGTTPPPAPPGSAAASTP